MKKLKALRELREELGAEVFLVGGTVRDLVRKREPNDLDVMVRGVAPADFEAFMRERGDLQMVGKSFGVYLFRPKRMRTQIEIAFPRTEISTGQGHRDFAVHPDPDIPIEEDAKRRDFTINAMYLSIDALNEKGKFDRKAVIDFHGGLEHIKRRLIVAVGNPEDRIKEDPLRMMRAMVLVARTGYRLEGNTFGAIKKNADLIKSVAAERVRDEFLKIMATDKPSRALKTMARTELLHIVFPELADCIGCRQNPKYHSYPVFEHLIYAADAACSITDRMDVRLGALFHDLGKAPTREVRPNGDGPDDVSFHNHEIVSTKLAFSFMKRLRFPKKFTEEVISLVRHHQYKYDRDWTDKAVRRFIRKLDLTKADLEDLDSHPQFLLRQADRMGNELKAHLPITQKQRDFQDRIRKVYHESSAHSLRDLKVSGKDIMTQFDVPAGPLVGQVIKHLFEAVEENPELNTKEALLEMAASFLEENSGSNQSDRKSAGSSQGAA
ncbi:MAG: HD domain-containing protein [Candidatus Altiarchaeales archaeon]|nr:HD domain-containing protein [Candidatus Altiarchaeales archaeon]